MSSFTINIAYATANEAVATDLAYQLSPLNVHFNLVGSEELSDSNGLQNTLLNSPNPCLLLISDNFLKSVACMENGLLYLQELVKNEQVIPIIIDGVSKDDSGNIMAVPTKFEKVSNVIKYMNYWQENYLELRKLKRSVPATEEEEFNLKLKKVRNISSEIGEFLRYLRETNFYSEEEFRKNNFEAFFRNFGDEDAYKSFLTATQSRQTTFAEEPKKEEPEYIAPPEIKIAQESPMAVVPPPFVKTVPTEEKITHGFNQPGDTVLESAPANILESPPVIKLDDASGLLPDEFIPETEEIPINEIDLPDEELEDYVVDEEDTALEEVALQEGRSLTQTELLALELSKKLPGTQEEEEEEEEEMISLADLMGEDLMETEIESTIIPEEKELNTLENVRKDVPVEEVVQIIEEESPSVEAVSLEKLSSDLAPTVEEETPINVTNIEVESSENLASDFAPIVEEETPINVANIEAVNPEGLESDLSAVIEEPQINGTNIETINQEDLVSESIIEEINTNAIVEEEVIQVEPELDLFQNTEEPELTITPMENVEQEESELQSTENIEVAAEPKNGDVPSLDLFNGVGAVSAGLAGATLIGASNTENQEEPTKEEESENEEELEGYFIDEGEEEEEVELSEIDILQASNILAQSGKITESIELLENALEEAPEFLSVRYQYAAFLAQYQNNFKEASNQLAILLEEEPSNLSAKFFLGELAEAERDYLSAKNYFEKVFEENPEYPNVQYKLGVLLVHHLKENPELAAQYFESAYVLNPNNINALYQLGVLQSESLDHEEKAIIAFERVLAKAPEHPFANYDLALLYYNIGDTDTALTYYQTACEINPELKTEENDQAFSQEEIDRSNEELSMESLNAEIDHKIGLQEVTAIRDLPIPPANLVNDITPNLVEEEEEADEITETVPVEQIIQKEPAKVVLITGATSGIGKATAELFAQNGYKLILTGRRFSRLFKMKEFYEGKFGTEIQLLPFDVRIAADVEKAISELSEDWRQIDILVNNAGLAKGFEPIHEGKLEDWEVMIDTNMKGLLYMTRAIAPFMVKRRKGHIINICSIAGKEVYPNGGVYCATKHGVDALTKAMRIDLHKYNIRVSQVAPGHVEDTEFALVRYDGDEESAKKVYEGFTPVNSKDVAEVIYFMASRPAHVNIQDVLMMGTQQASATITDKSGR